MKPSISYEPVIRGTCEGEDLGVEGREGESVVRKGRGSDVEKRLGPASAYREHTQSNLIYGEFGSGERLDEKLRWRRMVFGRVFGSPDRASEA